MIFEDSETIIVLLLGSYEAVQINQVVKQGPFDKTGSFLLSRF